MTSYEKLSAKARVCKTSSLECGGPAGVLVLITCKPRCSLRAGVLDGAYSHGTAATTTEEGQAEVLAWAHVQPGGVAGSQLADASELSFSILSLSLHGRCAPAKTSCRTS